MNATSARPENQTSPGVVRSVVHGSLGFALVSVAAFGIWAFGGRWFRGKGGEVGLYAAIAFAFVGLSGLLLHRLLRGPGSFARFYKAFVPAFLAYSVVWSGTWFALGSGLGEWLGSLAGSIVFAVITGKIMGNPGPWLKVSAVLFLTHSAGYFLGGQLMGWVLSPSGREALDGLSRSQISTIAKLGWGLLYGLGFGAGLGFALFTFQQKAPAADAQP
jgi:hypothetical protein